MTGRLANKVVFITGAARGQGRSHAVRFAMEGGQVIGLDICEPVPSVPMPMATEEDLAETVRLVEEAGGRMVASKGDVRDRHSLERALEAGLEEFGRIDCVLANAGIAPVAGETAQTMEAWHDCIDTHLTGALNTVEVTYPTLVEQGDGGSIVLTGSMAAVVPMMRTEDGHTLGRLGYSASKAALVNLARNYASFLAPHRIRVNTIHPTGVNTPMIQNSYFAEHHGEHANPEDMKVLINAIPVDAIEASDVTNLMVWLCSDESRYFTGNSVRLDAGADLR